MIKSQIGNFGVYRVKFEKLKIFRKKIEKTQPSKKKRINLCVSMKC
jgi:hypothetical protein